jgi:hypothetical protein
VKAAALLVLLVLAGAELAPGDAADMPSIADVKARHEARLLAQPGVVSVGLGRDADGRPVIVVGVERVTAELEEQLPRELEGHPVAVRPVGRVRAQ